jgi:phosphoribosylanthranilate isomerase
MILSKICGLRTPETVAAALDGGASHLGFMIFPKSPRHQEPLAHAAIAKDARGRAKIVAVVVDPTDALLDQIEAEFAPDMLQLHGDETVERVAAIRARGTPLIKALPVSTAQDVSDAYAYAPHVEAILFDAKPPPGVDIPGGNGVTMDWTLLKDANPGVAWFLSGGLTPENVAEAIGTSGARAVDVSSGVESARGLKDPQRITAFLKAVSSLS